MPRFVTTYYPRLQRTATVISADGSFTAPTVTGPRLLLHVAFRPQHRVDLHWQFAYAVGDGEYTVELYERLGDTIRDRDVEDALLAGIRPVVAPFGLENTIDRRLFSRLTCTGFDTARLVSELLPLLSGRDDVQVRVEGTPPPTTATSATACESDCPPRPRPTPTGSIWTSPSTSTVQPSRSARCSPRSVRARHI